ncbi:MAG: protein-L-isoaspartate(D-aspartate) O-methyltransferase, partial [Thermoguttaceae bacterium]
MMRYVFSALILFFLAFSTTELFSQEILAADEPIPVGFEKDTKNRLKEVWPIIPAAQQMVENELLPQGKLTNERVLAAVMRIPREKFVPPLHREMSYRDTALPIGNAQTISPPYIVTYMTEQLDPQPEDKVLEIGTGSGYQAAVLSLLVKEVYSIEIVEPLGKRAAQTLKKLGFKNVFTKVGDGYKGWPDAAPFDKIIVTCSPESVPQPLIDQLKEGGTMIVPVGERYQQLFYLFTKVNGELEKQPLTPALFVPMTGEAETNRVVLPDPKNPKLVGGDFEETSDTGHPTGWHYARNAKVISDETAPSGSNFMRFELPVPAGSNTILSVTPSFVPSPTQQNEQRKEKDKTTRDKADENPQDSESLNLRAAQVIQGFAIDGKSV